MFLFLNGVGQVRLYERSLLLAEGWGGKGEFGVFGDVLINRKGLSRDGGMDEEMDLDEGRDS